MAESDDDHYDPGHGTYVCEKCEADIGPACMHAECTGVKWVICVACRAAIRNAE